MLNRSVKCYRHEKALRYIIYIYFRPLDTHRHTGLMWTDGSAFYIAAPECQPRRRLSCSTAKGNVFGTDQKTNLAVMSPHSQCSNLLPGLATQNSQGDHSAANNRRPRLVLHPCTRSRDSNHSQRPRRFKTSTPAAAIHTSSTVRTDGSPALRQLPNPLFYPSGSPSSQIPFACSALMNTFHAIRLSSSIPRFPLMGSDFAGEALGIQGLGRRPVPWPGGCVVQYEII